MKMDVLLRRGSSIHARNNKGETCLHRYIQRARSCDTSSFEEEPFRMLIKNGADINACDNDNISVSQCAYSTSKYDWSRRVGGYRGDLWDAILTEYGYDISKTRRGFPRKPNYTERYTRNDFERMWTGREELCPYYHDPREWDPEGDFESLQDKGESLSTSVAEAAGS
jgi:hypothetical protein